MKTCHDHHTVDPVTVVVLQNRLNAIAEETDHATLCDSYSWSLNSWRDFSIALIGPRAGSPQRQIISRACRCDAMAGSRSGREARAWLAAQPDERFQFTFTPNHGSCLNLVEGLLSKLAPSPLRDIRVAAKQ